MQKFIPPSRLYHLISASTHRKGTRYGDIHISSIDADDNQEAGRRLYDVYRDNRVLDNDPFYVEITP